MKTSHNAGCTNYEKPYAITGDCPAKRNYEKNMKWFYKFCFILGIFLAFVLVISGVSAVGTFPAVDSDMVLYYHFKIS